MKKIFLNKAALAASALGLTMFNVAASANNCKFYAGAGIDYAKYSLSKEVTNSNDLPYMKDVKNKGFGLVAPVIGMTFHDNFGVEAGYVFAKPIKSTVQMTATNTIPGKFKISNMYLDLVGFMPVYGGQFDLIGGIGLGKINVKKDKSMSSLDVKFNNKVGFRVKAGAQYSVHSNVALRALVTYQSSNAKVQYQGDNEKFLKNMTSVGLSAIYTF